MELELVDGGGKIRIGSTVVRSPCYAQYSAVLDDVGAVQLVPSMDEQQNEADFELPSPSRNIVAFSADGTVRWIIDDPPAERHEAKRPRDVFGFTSEPMDYFRSVFTLRGSLYAIHDSNGTLYEVDPETGGLLASWPATELPLGDTVVEFEKPVTEVLSCVDVIVVKTFGEGYHGFDEGGSDRWHLDRQARLHCVDGELYEVRAGGPGAEWRVIYRLDRRTGDRLEEVASGQMVTIDDL